MTSSSLAVTGQLFMITKLLLTETFSYFAGLLQIGESVHQKLFIFLTFTKFIFTKLLNLSHLQFLIRIYVFLKSFAKKISILIAFEYQRVTKNFARHISKFHDSCKFMLMKFKF